MELMQRAYNLIIELYALFYASRSYNIKNVLEGLVMPKCVKNEVEVLTKSQQERLLSFVNADSDLTSLGITLAYPAKALVLLHKPFLP